MTFRNISSWGQLLGVEDSDPAFKGANRRLHVRHVCDQLAMCRSTDGETNALASVVNISRGGIGLIADTPFERGTVVMIELTLSEERPAFRLLACVLHASSRPNGYWALGCAFVTELDDADLRSFGIERPESAADAQSGERYPCQLKAAYRPIGVRLPKPCRGMICEISPGGVNMLTTQAVELGTVVRLELHRTGGQPELKTLACVVRVDARGDEEWLWGCNFIRHFSKHELAALLDIPLDTPNPEHSSQPPAHGSAKTPTAAPACTGNRA